RGQRHRAGHRSAGRGAPRRSDPRRVRPGRGRHLLLHPRRAALTLPPPTFQGRPVARRAWLGWCGGTNRRVRHRDHFRVPRPRWGPPCARRIIMANTARPGGVTRQIPRGEWKPFLERFTREHLREPPHTTTVEVLSPAMGDQLEARNQRLLGLNYDPKSDVL